MNLETSRLDCRAAEILADMPEDLAAAIRRVAIREHHEGRTRSIRDSLKDARQEGRKTGGREPPYGFRVEVEGGRKVLVQNPEEQKALSRIRELRDVGLSYERIAEDLTAGGVKPRGTRWYPGTIRVLDLRARRASEAAS